MTRKEVAEDQARRERTLAEWQAWIEERLAVLEKAARPPIQPKPKPHK